MAKLLDVVLTVDGKEGTIVEVFENGKAFMLEIADNKGRTLDTPIIRKEDIEKITYIA